MTSRNIKTLLICLTLLLTSCHERVFLLEPTLFYIPPERLITSLPSAFQPLSEEETASPWADELKIGQAFAKQLDFYRAITAFQRALILLPPTSSARVRQTEYGIVLSYYLAGKYQAAVEFFEQSSLREAPATFPALEELTLLLYDSFTRAKQPEKGERILHLIQRASPEMAVRLQLGKAIEKGDLPRIKALAAQLPLNPTLDALPVQFSRKAKSVTLAHILNAVLPGAGYLYVGQVTTAFTALLLNGLFIWATVWFFMRKNWPMALIMLSLELGWYLGGINGAGLAAKEYNEVLFNTLAKEAMLESYLFPVLMFETVY